MEQRNEPSTEEIAKRLKIAHDNLPYSIQARDTLAIYWMAVARERLLSLDFAEKRNAEIIASLTGRAEQAEKERNLAVKELTDYEDALFDECDKSYQSGFMDGFRSKEEMDNED